MATIHAIYASTSGNVEWVIDTIADAWRLAGHQVNTHRAEITSPDVIAENDLFLFGTSTWEHGELNPFFVKLYEAMEKMDFSNKSAFFIGCGDFRYEPVLFNAGIQFIVDRWKNNSGTELYHTLKFNNDPKLSADKLLQPWITATTELLATRSSS